MALFRDYQVTSSAEASDSDKSSRGASPRMGRSRKISAMGSLPALHTASYLQNTSLDDDTLAYSADADTLRDTFANPPSDRHYPPRAVQERQSLPSVSYDDGCKTWFWRRRNGSIARCKVGHREPTFRDWLRHVQKTFKKRGKARQSLIKGERPFGTLVYCCRHASTGVNAVQKLYGFLIPIIRIKSTGIVSQTVCLPFH